MSKFDNVPVEDGTTIVIAAEATLDEYEVLYQNWTWDGINAESMVFVADEVKRMDDEFVAESPLVKDKEQEMTLTRNSKGYTFVNFNFVSH